MERIGTHGAILGIEPGEIMLLELHFNLLVEEFEKHGGLAIGVCPRLAELFYQLLFLHAYYATHLEGIERADVARDNHQVVRLATLSQKETVTVVYLSARRILHNGTQGVVFSINLIAGVDNLQIEEPPGYHQSDEGYEDT
jgi:hypothetical protein